MRCKACSRQLPVGTRMPLPHLGPLAAHRDRSLEPLDTELGPERARATGAMVTAENHGIIGGPGSAVAEVLVEEGIGPPFRRVVDKDMATGKGTETHSLSTCRAPGCANPLAGR